MRGGVIVVSAMELSSLLDVFAAAGAPAMADLVAVLREAVADARGLVAGRADERDVVDAHRGLHLEHPARRHLRTARALDGARLGVTLDDVDLLDDHTALGRDDLEHLAATADVLAGLDLDEVTAADLELLCDLESGAGHHSTSGASETIFMKLRSRSSRATGPKMRVPRGLRAASMITAAFSSKAM